MPIAYLLLSVMIFSHDPLFAQDKMKHLAASCFIEQTIYQYNGHKNKSFGLTISVGIAKELYDWKVRKTMFSFKDLLYDFIGAGVGYLLFN